MLCDNCKQRQASIHITKIINGEKKEVHLCDQCTSLQEVGSNPFNFKNFITNFTEEMIEGKSPQIHEDEVSCDHCGMTYDAFKRYGKFGCEHCYDAFGDLIQPLIKRMQGKNHHVGKIAAHGGEYIKRKRELTELNEKLKRAVEQEEYEKAAVYRDKIKSISAEIENK